MKTQTLTMAAALIGLLTLSGCSNNTSQVSANKSTATLETNVTNVATENSTEPTSSNETYVATVTLPSSFTASPSGYPVGLFWAYENVESKYNGYDLSKELGKTVKVYRVSNHFVFKDENGSIVGDDAPTATFAKIVHEKFSEWIEQQHPPYSQARLSMSPQDTIKAYYQAINQHNDTLAWSYADPAYAWNFMMSALPHGLPNPQGWGSSAWSNVIQQIQVLSIKDTLSINPSIHYNVPTKFFKVTTKGTYNQGFVYPSGINTWVVKMAKPTPASPWMFDGTPTGGY